MKLPHDIPAEQAVLGAIIIDPDKITEVISVLPDPEMFYAPKHRQIYAAMLEQFEAGAGIDVVELAAKTKDITALTTVANVTPTSANAERYAAIVKEKAVARNLVKACHEGMSIAANESCQLDDRVATVEAEIRKATENTFTGKNKAVKDLAKICVRDYGKIKAPCIKSGFYDLDGIITGFKPGELTVIAGRTSMGKTTLALDIARNAAESGAPVQIFSLEMTAERITDRLICAQGKIPGQAYRRGDESITGDVVKAAEKIYHLPISIYDSRVTTAEIRAQCLRNRSVQLAVVDFLTLVKDKRIGNVSTADHVGEIAKRLQEIAKELRIPFLVVSQMNRNIESRDDKMPRLSDLRESGNVEEAADTIIFLHRDNYYDREAKNTNTAKVVVAKQRDGPTSSTELSYFDYIPTFRNLAKVGEDQ